MLTVSIPPNLSIIFFAHPDYKPIKAPAARRKDSGENKVLTEDRIFIKCRDIVVVQLLRIISEKEPPYEAKANRPCGP
jgi:hypothetical protein